VTEPSTEQAFPLVPRHRLLGLSFGGTRSLRRGVGTNVAGSRPYRPGDNMRSIDWRTSAKLSAARSADIFVVREHDAEEAPRILIVLDRRPQMAHFRTPFPWLDKADAMRRVIRLILQSTVQAGGYAGYLDFADGTPHWRPAQAERRLLEQLDQHLFSAEMKAPPDTLEVALRFLSTHRLSVSPGTFVFVLSDFIPTPSKEMWAAAQERRWDIIPVIFQDPTWDQSFPDVAGIVVPLSDPATGRTSSVRLRGREVAARRAANELRLRNVLEMFRALDIEPVLVSSNEPAHILDLFLAWAALRRAAGAHGT
jgi:uncharacterized protein (DUF58 family)